MTVKAEVVMGTITAVLEITRDTANICPLDSRV